MDMGLAGDFELLWEQQKKQIESAILQQEKKTEGISCMELQKAYLVIARKWLDSLTAEYKFVKRVRREDLKLADAFQKKLTGFAFKEAARPQMPSVVPYIGVECAVCLVGAFFGFVLASRSFIGRYLSAGIVMPLAAVFLGFMTAGIINDLYQNKRQEIWHKTGDEYRMQIEMLGKELAGILRGK